MIALVAVTIQQADEAKRMAQQAAANQPRESQQAEIVVAPAQTRSITFQTPSEIAAAQRAAKIAQIKEIKDYWDTHPQERAAQQAAAAEAAQEKAARDKKAGHEEALEIKRKYEWEIQSHRNKPASSISVFGAAFPKSDEARDVKNKYDWAIIQAGDRPASSIHVFP
jgi:hypothetical protein